MKSKILWIISAVALVGIIAGASVLYNKLSSEYSADNLASNTQAQETTASENIYAAPDFTVLDSNGRKVRLSDYKGKPIVLNFWTTWCYYCNVEMPDFNKAYAKYPEVQFMMVNGTDGVQETMEIAKEYIAQEGFSFDVFYDTQLEAVSAYQVGSFPTTFFIDKDGSLVTYANGMLDLEALEKGISMISE